MSATKATEVRAATGAQAPSELSEQVELREPVRLTGGYRIGGLGPADLLPPPHAGLTLAQERARWLDDLARWDGQYRALLENASRLRSYVLRKLRDIGRHVAEIQCEAEQLKMDTTTKPASAAGKASHLRLRQAHQRIANDCRHDVASLSRIKDAVADANWSTNGNEPAPELAGW